MKLQYIKEGLEKKGIPAEIVDLSIKKEVVDESELWKNIESDLRELEKWYQKKDIVMVAIRALSIVRDADEIMSFKKGTTKKDIK